MDAQDAVDFGREAFSICLTLGAPVLIVGLVVGIIVGVLQAMTHVQDQTVSFVPKIVVIVAALAFSLPWLTDRMLEYSRQMFEKPHLISNSWETE